MNVRLQTVTNLPSFKGNSNWWSVRRVGWNSAVTHQDWWFVCVVSPQQHHCPACAGAIDYFPGLFTATCSRLVVFLFLFGRCDQGLRRSSSKKPPDQLADFYNIFNLTFFFSYKTIPSETRTHKMHKENCTVTFVMSGHGLNMSVVIYNGGLLSRSTTPSGSAPQPRDLRGEEGLQEESCDGDSRTKQQPIMPLYQQERAWSLCLSSPWL